MSRTYRDRPCRYKKGGSYHAKLLNGEYSRFYSHGYDVNRDRLVSGRDGGYTCESHGASNDSPKGYDTWDDHGSGSKMYLKRQTAKVMRRRHQHEASLQLNDM